MLKIPNEGVESDKRPARPLVAFSRTVAHPPSLLRLFMGGDLNKSRKQSRAGGCGEAGGEVPPDKKSRGDFGL